MTEQMNPVNDDRTDMLQLFQVKVEVLPQSINTDEPPDMDYADVCLAHEALVGAMGELGYVRQIFETVSDMPNCQTLQLWVVLAKSFDEADMIVNGTPLGRDGYIRHIQTLPIKESYAAVTSRTMQPYPRPGNIFERLLQRFTLDEGKKILDNVDRMSTNENLLLAYCIFNWADALEQRNGEKEYEERHRSRWRHFTNLVKSIGRSKQANQALDQINREIRNQRALFNEFYMDIDDDGTIRPSGN